MRIQPHLRDYHVTFSFSESVPLTGHFSRGTPLNLPGPGSPVFYQLPSPPQKRRENLVTKGRLNSAIPPGDRDSDYQSSDAYGRLQQNRIHAGCRQQKQRNTARGTANRRIVTQNVRGFREQVRLNWLSAWREMPVRDRPEAWCIQETHVSTPEAAADLEQNWRRLWGKAAVATTDPMSYWSVGTASAGGVAILLTHESAKGGQLCAGYPCTSRLIAF